MWEGQGTGPGHHFSSSRCALLPAFPHHSASLRPPVQPAEGQGGGYGRKEGGPEPLSCTGGGWQLGVPHPR